MSLPALGLRTRHVVSRRAALIAAVVAALATAALALALHDWVPGKQFLFLYMPMVAAVGYLGGRMPGYVAWAISVATVTYLLVPPSRSLGWNILLAVFAAAGAVAVEGAARLRAAEAAAHRFALLVESSGDAIFSATSEGIVQTWNHGAERLYGYTDAEAIGRPVTRLLAPECAQTFQGFMARVGGGGHIEHFETMSVSKYGAEIATSVALSPLPNARGHIAGVSIIARDITERQRAEHQQRLLLEISERLTSSLDLAARIDALIQSVVPALADFCAVRLTADDGTLRLAALAHRDAGLPAVRDLQQRAALSLAQASGPARLYQDIRADGIDQSIGDAQLREFVRRLGARSMIWAPMRARDRVIGDLVLCSTGTSGRYTTQDFAAAEQLAHFAALALDNARLHDKLATTLQHSLLPGVLPSVSGVRIDSAYLPAAVGAGVGGDWYDAFRLRDGRLVVTVGDVAGHGLNAAVRMGELRHAIRALALAGHGPVDVLRVADDVIRSSGGGMATAVVLMLDPVTLEYTYAAAGHPPPIIATGERVEMLEQRSVPLGLGHPASAAPGPASLPEDGLIVLYTDGLIEIDRDPAGGEAALLAAVAEEYAVRLDQPAQSILSRVIGARTPPDDIAIVTVAVARPGGY
jgi:PAS domain S-box-containing protein